MSTTQEPTTQHGFCRDCAQGSLTRGPGFAQYIDDDGNPQHWYCKYCGSNHVDIKDEAGNIIYRGGDLYEEA